MSSVQQYSLMALAFAWTLWFFVISHCSVSLSQKQISRVHPKWVPLLRRYEPATRFSRIVLVSRRTSGDSDEQYSVVLSHQHGQHLAASIKEVTQARARATANTLSKFTKLSVSEDFGSDHEDAARRVRRRYLAVQVMSSLTALGIIALVALLG